MHKPWFNFGGPLLIEQGLSPERRSHNLAVTVLHVPRSLDTGGVRFVYEVARQGGVESPGKEGDEVAPDRTGWGGVV